VLAETAGYHIATYFLTLQLIIRYVAYHTGAHMMHVYVYGYLSKLFQMSSLPLVVLLVWTILSFPQ
jgi:hypothetical protein